MRTIKFRGKTIDTGDWVYGDLIQQTDEDIFILGKEWWTIHSKVDPETIGQFTGLNDKEGYEIWEEDVVKLYNNNTGYVKVFWNQDKWSIRHGDDILDSMLNHLNNIEVLGNIHDNPELL